VSADFNVEQFIYIKIPGAIQPSDRSDIFEGPIDMALASGKLGHVSGGGTLLGRTRPDGIRPIEFCGIDINTTDRETALKVLRNLLPALCVPLGTELHYTAEGIRLQDRFLGTEWTTGDARTFLHPGFDI
jgi:hypothetical protein